VNLLNIFCEINYSLVAAAAAAATTASIIKIYDSADTTSCCITQPSFPFVFFHFFYYVFTGKNKY